MRPYFTILLLLFLYHGSYAANKAIIKANVLRGESFVTAAVEPSVIENIVANELKSKGFQIVGIVRPGEDILYVDLFVFQFPAANPTITLTIRSKDGIHYIDREKVALFGNRVAANIGLAQKLSQRIPSQINLGKIYQPALRDIVGNTGMSLISLSSSAITESYRSSYSSSLHWHDDNAPAFLIPEEFDTYMAYASNYQGIRAKVKEQPIKLKLKINNAARFELLDIESAFALTDKQKSMFHEFVNSFPLWITDSPIDSVELIFGAK